MEKQHNFLKVRHNFVSNGLFIDTNKGKQNWKTFGNQGGKN